jgi:hypothetical protein
LKRDLFGKTKSFSPCCLSSSEYGGREIYRESGNLAISEFPNTLKFAISIAEALDLEHIENVEKDGVGICVSPKKRSKSSR